MDDTTEPKPNIALLDQTLDYIKTHPQEWDQESWRCSSGMCFAGTAAMLAGGTFPFSADDDRMADGFPLSANRELVDDESGLRHEIDLFAQRHLGLTDDEAEDLFAGGNRIPQLADTIAAIKQGNYR